MTTFYLVRTSAEFTGIYTGNKTDSLHTFDQEETTLSFVIDRMQGLGGNVLDIIKVDFTYGNIKYTPLEITINRAKFKLTPIPQEPEQQK